MEINKTSRDSIRSNSGLIRKTKFKLLLKFTTSQGGLVLDKSEPKLTILNFSTWFCQAKLGLTMLFNPNIDMCIWGMVITEKLLRFYWA